MIRSVGGISCMTLSDNDAIQQQQPPKTRIHSLPKTLVLSSGAGSPVSEGITIIPSVEMEQTILERFAEIEMVTITNGSNRNARKNKVDNCIRKPTTHSPRLVAHYLTAIERHQ
ncbi:unnamed protein product [Rhodiola kirilowii]